MIEQLKQRLTAFSTGNWTDYKAGLASNVTYDELATRQRLTGVDNYIELLKRWKRAFPDVKGTVINFAEAGDQVFAEVEWVGTQSGPLEGPFGQIAATNKRAVVRAVIVERVRDNKVIEARHYFDMLTLLMQLGIAPMAGATAPQPGKPAAPPTRH